MLDCWESLDLGTQSPSPSPAQPCAAPYNSIVKEAESYGLSIVKLAIIIWPQSEQVFPYYSAVRQYLPLPNFFYFC